MNEDVGSEGDDTEADTVTEDAATEGAATGETEAIEALKRLGLSSYEAQVFIALGRVETATARDIDRMTDVPRSQVYGAAESLEERGLLDVQQSNPRRFRAVELEEARKRLHDRLVREEERAFEYLENAREEREAGEETQEAVWTVHGSETVSDRIASLARDATDRVVFGTKEPTLLDETVRETLRQVAGTGIEVIAVSENSAVREQARTIDGVTVRQAPSPAPPEAEERGGRILVVDHDTVLLSMLGGQELPGVRRETAIWSSDTGFATMFADLLAGWIDHPTEE